MNVAEVTEVCRLCPTKAIDPNQKLINIFDYTVTEKYNLKDVIFMTTGVEILQNDLVSVKICQRCMNITLKMSQFRGDAQKQDRHLKGRLNEILTEKVLAKTKYAKVIVPKPIAIKIEPEVLHPSITNIYRNNPCLKIPKACIGQHMDPVVSLVKDEAEQYLRKRKLNTTGPSNSKAQPSIEKTVSPLRISKMQCDNRSAETYFCINKSSLPTTSSTTSSNGINNLTPVNLRLPTTPPPADATSSMVRSVEFLQNFDLTPTVKTLKTQEVCVCEHCGSVHNNTFERKRHINRVHTLCQFCKKKFKTVETKIRHQENGCKISETDIVSRKICPKCLKHAQKIYQIRQIASKQDKHLKELSVKYLDDKGIRLPNTCITMKRNIQTANRADRKLTPLTESTCTKSKIIKKTEKFKPYPPLLPFTSTMKPIKGLHQSVIDVYRRFPKFKLPKKCLDRHLAPIISLTMGEVETFFKENKLDMNKFIYRSHHGNNAQPRIKCNNVARKKTATPVKSVADLRKQKKNMPSDEICKLLNVVANEAENSRKPIEIPEVPVVRPSAVRRGRPMKFFRNPACSKLISPIKCESDKQVIETISNVVCNQLDDSAPVNETLVKIKEESISPKIRQKKRMLLLPNSTYQKMCKVFEHQYPTQPEIEAQPTERSPPESLSNTSKPDFIQSLGLAPAGEAVVPKSILVCKICGSVHKNVTSLKTHSSRHRICPHCKLKFKSVERKQNHIEKDCETKKILESPGSFISLTRAELDDDLRENYLEAFYNAEIVLRPEEQIVLDDDDDDDEIILVSDDTTKKITSSEAEQSIDSVSIIKPIIKIHNNSLLDQLGNNTNEKEFLNDLVYLFRQKYPAFQSAQTDQPLIKSQDVVFEENARCRLKNLKELLLTYNVPVSFQNGSLNVSFQPYTPLPNKKCELDTWNDLPLIDKQDPPNQSYPVTFVQSSQLSLSSIQVMTATPTMSIILPNAISIQTGVNNSPQTTQFFTPNTQQTATLQPMVQNYTIPINFPVIKNQMSVSSPSSAPTTSPKRECAAATAESSPTTSSSSSKSSSSDVELTASPKTKTKKLRVRMARSLRLRKVWELN